MEKLPIYAYFPFGLQIIQLVIGLYLAATALPKMDSPSFAARKHERYGRIFLILVLVGAVVAKLVDVLLPADTMNVPGHALLSVAVVVLVVTGAIFGFEGGRMRLRVKTGMMQAHPWFIVLAVALIFAQGILGIGAKGLRLINF